MQIDSLNQAPRKSFASVLRRIMQHEAFINTPVEQRQLSPVAYNMYQFKPVMNLLYNTTFVNLGQAFSSQFNQLNGTFHNENGDGVLDVLLNYA